MTTNCMISGFIEHVGSMIKLGSLKLDVLVWGLMDNNCVWNSFYQFVYIHLLAIIQMDNSQLIEAYI